MNQETLSQQEIDELHTSVTLLRNALQQHICMVTFTKSDGTERTMYCTLRNDSLPSRTIEEAAESYKRQKEQRPRPFTNISVWDLENNAWRSFNIDKVDSFVVGVEFPPNKPEHN
jgi:hypothetical protein